MVQALRLALNLNLNAFIIQTHIMLTLNISKYIFTKSLTPQKSEAEQDPGLWGTMGKNNVCQNQQERR